MIQIIINDRINVQDEINIYCALQYCFCDVPAKLMNLIVRKYANVNRERLKNSWQIIYKSYGLKVKEELENCSGLKETKEI